MKTLRDLLIQKALEDSSTKVEDIDDEVLEETLREGFNTVYEFPTHYEGRWRTESNVVAAILDDNIIRYFSYSTCYSTDSNSWEDAGYSFEGIDNVAEVFPKEITTTTYVTENKL